jgi:hypothetical protein
MTKEGVWSVVVVVVLWLVLFAYWHPASTVLKWLVLTLVAVIGMTAASYFVT